MTNPLRTIPLFSLCAFLASTGMAQTIDPNKPLVESLKPGLLYFNFDEEEGGVVVSRAELRLTATVERGKVEAPPARKPGPGAAFGKALEFNYGSHPPFPGANGKIAGNHLRVSEQYPELQLAGQSFTMGAWIQLPEGTEPPSRPYKRIIGKGGHSDSYAGWALQVGGRNGVWSLTLLLVDSSFAQTRCDARLPAGGLEPGVWHHVAASFDAEAKKVVLWFDGVKVFSGDAPVEVGESRLPLVVGENGMSTYSNFPLTLDEVFIVSGVHDFAPVNH